MFLLDYQQQKPFYGKAADLEPAAVQHFPGNFSKKSWKLLWRTITSTVKCYKWQLIGDGNSSVSFTSVMYVMKETFHWTISAYKFLNLTDIHPSFKEIPTSSRDISRAVLLPVNWYGILNSYPKLIKN